MAAYNRVPTERRRQCREPIPASVPARRPTNPTRRRGWIRAAVIASAITIATAAGSGIAAAMPEPEPSTPARAIAAYTAPAVPILRSNVPIDAWVHERFFYGGRLDTLTPIAVTQRDIDRAERHYGPEFGG